VVASGENLGDEGKNYEAERHYLVLVSVVDVGLSSRKEGQRGEMFEMTSPVRVLLTARDLRDVRYPYAVQGLCPFAIGDGLCGRLAVSVRGCDTS